jgi:3-methyladenine DNA glycosylase AlkD
VLSWLKAHGTARNREGMARFGILSPKIFGVSMATMRPLVKRIGRDHELAAALWESGWLEARILASFVDDPAQVTAAQMERWARDFDNWAVCDSVCLHLFSYAGPRWSKATIWSRRKAEFVRRASCALMASLAVHDKAATDRQFLACMAPLGAIATDERPMVKKGVSWALRQIGKRNGALNAAAVAVAERLVAHERAPAQWIGRDVLKELRSDAVQARLARRATTTG